MRPAIGPFLSCLALSIGLIIGGCGGDDEKDEKDQSQLPTPKAPGRYESPAYDFTIRARPPARNATVSGKEVEGRGDYVVVVRLGVKNRRSRPLSLAQITATLKARDGASYDPVLADGRAATRPLFATDSLAPDRVIGALVAYRVPPKDLEGSDLRVADRASGQAFQQHLF